MRPLTVSGHLLYPEPIVFYLLGVVEDGYSSLLTTSCLLTAVHNSDVLFSISVLYLRMVSG